jgi:hypothetical protein
MSYRIIPSLRIDKDVQEVLHRYIQIHERNFKISFTKVTQRHDNYDMMIFMSFVFIVLFLLLPLLLLVYLLLYNKLVYFSYPLTSK